MPKVQEMLGSDDDVELVGQRWGAERAGEIIGEMARARRSLKEDMALVLEKSLVDRTVGRERSKLTELVESRQGRGKGRGGRLIFLKVEVEAGAKILRRRCRRGGGWCKVG